MAEPADGHWCLPDAVLDFWAAGIADVDEEDVAAAAAAVLWELVDVEAQVWAAGLAGFVAGAGREVEGGLLVELEAAVEVGDEVGQGVGFAFVCVVVEAMRGADLLAHGGEAETKLLEPSEVEDSLSGALIVLVNWIYPPVNGNRRATEDCLGKMEP